MSPELIAIGFAFALLLAKTTTLALKGQLGHGTFLLSIFFALLFWGGIRPIADAMSGQGYIRIWSRHGILHKYSRDKHPNLYAFVLILCFVISMAVVVAAFVVPPIDLLQIEVVD